MENYRRTTIAARPPLPSLDKAIKQQFTPDDERYHATLACIRRSQGPGWLYRLEGKIYYSPNCCRPNVKVPPLLDSATPTNNRVGGGDTTQGSSYNRHISHFRHPQWATKHWTFLAFTLVSPNLAAPPLYPLLYLPQIVEDATSNPHPDPLRWNRWIELQQAITESCNILLGYSGAPALRAALPHPCNKVSRLISTHTYKGKSAKLYHDILQARSLFEVWLSCLSYSIAVNQALVNQTNAFPLSNLRLPIPWIELLLSPPESPDRGDPLPHQPSVRPKYSQHPPTNHIPSSPRSKVDAVFVSSLRNTCITNFNGSSERVGLFLEIPGEAQDIVSIDWLIECRIPVWYPWGQREENIVKRYPLLARYRPPPDAVWVNTPSSDSDAPEIIAMHSVDHLPIYDDIEPMAAQAADISGQSNPGFAKRWELPANDRNWEGFFALADSKEHLLRQTETAKEREEREARRLDPPLTRPETTFYTWERTMRGTFRRRISTDEDLEGLFQENGHFGRNQARYNSFYNEWDLCRYWGAPDDDQLLFRATAQAMMKGTSVHAELLWWKVYYGLLPDPSTQHVPLPEVFQDTSEDRGGVCLHCPVRQLVSPQHELTKESPGEFTQPVYHIQTDMEDGEIADLEVIHPEPVEDLSWIARRAYHFFGFTLPLNCGAPNPRFQAHRSVLGSTFQTPAHVPRLLGVSKKQATEKYWNSTEGQAIIRFARSLASKDPPELSSWDLHRWNATPVATLPLFKFLKSFSAPVLIQAEQWDNVKG